MKDDAIVSRFNQASKQYQTDSVTYRKLSSDKVSQLLAPTSTDTVLDIGCGTGAQLIELSKTIKKGIGLDISSGMVAEAAKRSINAGCTNLEFHAGDFLCPEREISLVNRKVNKIISNYALHHLTLANKKEAVKKMIEAAGDSLEMIVLGDLMFFDDPQNYTDQYEEIGYNPENDQPSGVNELAGLFSKDLFSVTLEKIHPLVGVLRAVRKNG